MTRSPAQEIEYRNRNPRLRWARESVRSHTRCGYEVKISRMELYEYAKTIDACEDCGMTLDWGYGHGQSRRTPTLDRRDNGGIVESGNIAIVCHSCSSRKYTMSMNEWKLLKDGRLRRCSKCGQLKPIDQFSLGRRHYGGRRNLCKKCVAENTQEWRLKNGQRRRGYLKKYRTEKAGRVERS